MFTAETKRQHFLLRINKEFNVRKHCDELFVVELNEIKLIIFKRPTESKLNVS